MVTAIFKLPITSNFMYDRRGKINSDMFQCITTVHSLVPLIKTVNIDLCTGRRPAISGLGIYY